MALRSNLLSLLYPRTCPMCGRYLSDETVASEHIEWICPQCWIRLPRTEQDMIRQNETEEVLADEKRLEKAAAYLFFEKDHPVQYLIHKMKYSDQPMLGFWMARQAVLDCDNEAFFDDIDLIVPMPLHPKRLRERGYNQSEYIALGISEITGIPVDTAHVVRVINTPKQALQEGEERKKNVANAFEVINPRELADKHILVVDDLITTGETMKACLKAMHAIKGVRFTVFALCKAR